MITATQALAQITTGMTVDDLRNLAATVDVSVGNTTLILFSGGVGEIGVDGRYAYGAGEIAKSFSEASDIGNGKTVTTISDTERSSFLNDPQFRSALEDAMLNDPTYDGVLLSEV